MPLAELIASSPAEPDWIWLGYLAPGVITVLAGRPKVGKSTLLFALIAAINGGSSFCGRSTRRVSIVLLSEERAATVLDKARPTSWTNLVSVLLHQTAYGTSWAEIVRQAAEHVGAGGLLIVDTLADFAGLPADSENNAGAIQEAIRPLQEAAANHRAVLLVTHQRKAAGEHGEAVRGSNALTAAADIVVELERAPSSLGPQGRVLKAMSRFGNTPGDLVVSLSEDGYEARGELAGATAAAELDRAANRLGEMDQPTAEELAEDIGISKGSVQRHLNALHSAGRAARAGIGKRGDPFRWRLVLDSAREIPHGRIDSAARSAIQPGRPRVAMPLDSTQGIEATRFDSSRISKAVRPDIEPRDADAMDQAVLDMAQIDARWLPEGGADA